MVPASTKTIQVLSGLQSPKDTTGNLEERHPQLHLNAPRHRLLKHHKLQ